MDSEQIIICANTSSVVRLLPRHKDLSVRNLDLGGLFPPRPTSVEQVLPEVSQSLSLSKPAPARGVAERELLPVDFFDERGENPPSANRPSVANFPL